MQICAIRFFTDPAGLRVRAERFGGGVRRLAVRVQRLGVRYRCRSCSGGAGRIFRGRGRSRGGRQRRGDEFRCFYPFLGSSEVLRRVVIGNETIRIAGRIPLLGRGSSRCASGRIIGIRRFLLCVRMFESTSSPELARSLFKKSADADVQRNVSTLLSQTGNRRILTRALNMLVAAVTSFATNTVDEIPAYNALFPTVGHFVELTKI